MDTQERKKAIPLNDILNEIKQKDPSRYQRIQEMTEENIQEYKKHGGYRPNAGRKPTISGKNVARRSFTQTKETWELIDIIAEQEGITKAAALERLIVTGYKIYKAS